MADLKSLKLTTATDSGYVVSAGATDAQAANIMLNSFRVAIAGGFSLKNMKDGFVDEYEDNTGYTGYDAASYNTANDYVTNSGTGAGNTISYTGSEQNYTVPGGASTIIVKMWGAGGGSDHDTSPGTIGGGGGGYSTAIIPTTPAEVLKVVVGGGGTGAATSAGTGGGGGYSGIFRTSVANTNALLMAGGGGGQGDNATAKAGAGGGTSGIQGYGTGPTQNGPTGGSQTVGGTASAGSGAGAIHGSSMQGGIGSGGNNAAGGTGGYGGGADGGGQSGVVGGGGGGGGGYFGGGGGGTTYAGAGGGGGSGFSHANNTAVTLTAGSDRTPGNNSDSDKAAGIGWGATGGSNVGGTRANGNNGVVIITPSILGNKRMISDAQTAASSPSTASLIVFEQNIDSVTLNTDLKGYATRDAGRTFTTDYGTDNKLDISSHGLSNDDRITVSSSSTIPAGLAAGTVYYVVNKTTNDFELSASSGGSAVNITSNGSGTHTAVLWKTATLVDQGDYDAGKQILADFNISLTDQPAGTSMRYMIEVLNTKACRIHGTALEWS
jgi:hypothetical protein